MNIENLKETIFNYPLIEDIDLDLILLAITSPEDTVRLDLSLKKNINRKI